MKNFQIIAGGAAGEGSKRAGSIIAKFFNAYGFCVFVHEDYQSLIRGGHNFSQISASQKEVNAISEKIDFLLALDENTIKVHGKKLKKGGVLICDSKFKEKADNLTKVGIEILEIPLDKIIKEANGVALMKNTALVSAFSKIIGMEWKKVSSVLKRELKAESERNIKVAKIAFTKTKSVHKLKKTGKKPMPLISGNKAAALGAIDAGLEVYFSYPMTPSTGILQFFSSIKGVATLQPENEIAVVNMALGSAYAGKRTMTGTSGGGFALMTEGVSLSAQSETPFFVALSQRMGPATGVPTYEAQGDLLFALNSGHGDMMRFVTAPGDAEEAYYLSAKSLNIAWKYQMPSILLLDKEISENTYNIKSKNKAKKENEMKGRDGNEYNRYDGNDISPILHPGKNAVIKVTGYEHDKKGITTEDSKEIKKMQEKRIRKYKKLEKELEKMEAVKTYKTGSTVIVFWGSNKGVVMEATKSINAKLVQPLVMQPFPEKQIKKALSQAKKIICVETNTEGQLARLLSGYGIKVDKKILKYDGRPFTIEELETKIREATKK